MFPCELFRAMICIVNVKACVLCLCCACLVHVNGAVHGHAVCWHCCRMTGRGRAVTSATAPGCGRSFAKRYGVVRHLESVHQRTLEKREAMHPATGLIFDYDAVVDQQAAGGQGGAPSAAAAGPGVPIAPAPVLPGPSSGAASSGSPAVLGVPRLFAPGTVVTPVGGHGVSFVPLRRDRGRGRARGLEMLVAAAEAQAAPPRAAPAAPAAAAAAPSRLQHPLRQEEEGQARTSGGPSAPSPTRCRAKTALLASLPQAREDGAGARGARGDCGRHRQPGDGPRRVAADATRSCVRAPAISAGGAQLRGVVHVDGLRTGLRCGTRRPCARTVRGRVRRQRLGHERE